MAIEHPELLKVGDIIIGRKYENWCRWKIDKIDSERVYGIAIECDPSQGAIVGTPHLSWTLDWLDKSEVLFLDGDEFDLWVRQVRRSYGKELL